MQHLIKKTETKRTIVRSKPQQVIKKLIAAISYINPMLGADIGLNAFFTPLNRRKRVDVFPKGTRTEGRIIQGKKVTIYKYGTSKRKVLLVHGWEGAATDFSHFFEPLVQNDYQVVAIDLPGHGLSPKSKLNAVLTGEIIKELEIKNGPYSAIIAHSFGAFSTGYALSKFKELESIPFVSVGSPNKLTSIISNFIKLAGFSKLQGDYIFSKIEKDLDIRAEEFEQGKFLRTHDGPVLVVHDKDDKQVSFKVIDEIKNESIYLKYLLTEGLGHNRILKDDETIRYVLKFLNSWKDTREQFRGAHKFGLV